MTEHPAPPRARWMTAAAVCTLVWSSTFLFISIGNDTLPALWACTLRLGAAAAILTLVGLARRERFPAGAALRSALLYGLFQFGINFPLLYWAEKTLPSGLSAIVFATIPLQAALLAWRAGLEPLSPARLAGGGVALAGIALIFGGQMQGPADPWPLVAVIVSTLCANIGSLLLKVGPRQSPVMANATGAALGAVISWGLSALAGERPMLPPTAGSWIALAYLTLAGSVVSFVLWAWLVARMPISRIAFTAVISPLLGLMLGVIVRHERLGPLTVAGAAVVLAGIAIGLQLVPFPARVPARGVSP
jgi:drug/metabolite transporter (DMT)-like permease